MLVFDDAHASLTDLNSQLLTILGVDVEVLLQLLAKVPIFFVPFEAFTVDNDQSVSSGIDVVAPNSAAAASSICTARGSASSGVDRNWKCMSSVSFARMHSALRQLLDALHRS